MSADAYAWVVQVIRQRTRPRALVREHFYACVPDERTAVNTVRQAQGCDEDDAVEALYALNENDAHALGLMPGEVKRR